MGGSVDVTVFVGGVPADYAEEPRAVGGGGWTERGATGWEYGSLLPYARRSES